MKIVNGSFVLLGSAALALFVAGCQKQEGAAAADPQAVKNAIKADEKKWNDQFKSKDTEGPLFRRCLLRCAGRQRRRRDDGHP